ncbi:MAG: class I SAM-dependent methyltransferase [Chloroflexota bacterium]
MDSGHGTQIVLSYRQAEEILRARERGDAGLTVSTDLGLTTEPVKIGPAGAAFRDGITVSWDDIEMIAGEDTKCFEATPEGVRSISVFSETTNWVRSLMPTSGAPTTLVGGFPMHRIKDTDPMADTREKVKALRPVRGRVLDTATGLGYTAIEMAKYAEHVVTVELDPAAVEIARMNPWSKDLFTNLKIELITGDIGEIIHEFDDASFDRVLHDPPTLALAGELYSGDFYRQLHRVLARKGRLFHYIGDPEGRTGRRTTSGVVQRLQEAGFRRVDRRPQAYGVVAYR